MKKYLVMYAIDYSAPELGHWFFCDTEEEVRELVAAAGFDPDEIYFREFTPGEWVEECGGGTLENVRDHSAIRAIRLDFENQSHKNNLQVLKELIESFRS